MPGAAGSRAGAPLPSGPPSQDPTNPSSNPSASFMGAPILLQPQHRTGHLGTSWVSWGRVPIPGGSDGLGPAVLPALGPAPGSARGPWPRVPRQRLGARAGERPGCAVWEPDGPWARLRGARFLPRPRGTERRRGLRSARARCRRLRRRQHDLGAQILFSTGEGRKKKKEKRLEKKGEKAKPRDE